MIRAVLDANVIVSGIVGLIRENSVPGDILRLLKAGRFEAAASDVLITEIDRTLSKDYFSKKISEQDHQDALLSLQRVAIDATILQYVQGVAPHPEDDLILATAFSAEVGFLVTGDKQLLARDGFRQLRIVTLREFLGLIQTP